MYRPYQTASDTIEGHKISPTDRAKYTRSYYIANWSNELTKGLFYWYRDNYNPSFFYFMEYEDLDYEIDTKTNPFTQFNTDQLRTIVEEKENEIWQLSHNAKLLLFKKRLVNLQSKARRKGFTKEKFQQEFDKIENETKLYSDKVKQELSNRPAIERPLDKCRELIKKEILERDKGNNLEGKGGIYRLNTFEKLMDLILELSKVNHAFTVIILFKIEKFRDSKNPFIATEEYPFIAIWKRLEKAGLVR